MSEKELLSSEKSFDDNLNELNLRPYNLAQYIGQEELKKEIKIYIEAAKIREESLDHVLLYGPPGLGKTTLAGVIANELEVNFKTTTGPALEKPGDLVALLSELNAGDILFIDEIHRMPKNIEEILYSAMEDFFIDIIVGQDSTAHPVHFQLPPFTLIGATTRGGLLSAPLRARFGILGHMQYYNEKELSEIVLRSARVLKTNISLSGAKQIALRSRGTPRIANRLLKRIRDFAIVASKNEIDLDTVNYALRLLKVDESGLDDLDRKMLKTMITLYNGGPVGINTIAANIGEEKDTISDMLEPYLLQKGFLKRTSRGRMVTKKAYKHLKIPYEKRSEH